MVTLIRAIVLAALLSAGCAGSFEEAQAPSLRVGAPPPSARCISLDDARRTWHLSAVASGGVAGGAALTPLWGEIRESVPGRITAAAVGGVAAIWLVVSEKAQADLGESWARECSAR